jgi:hypothetical protein
MSEKDSYFNQIMIVLEKLENILLQLISKFQHMNLLEIIKLN